MIDKSMEEAINQQINAELSSSYLYLGMAAYFQSLNLPGSAHWLVVQAEEERAHAMKLFDFVVVRNGRVFLSAIQEPPRAWDSPLAAFQAVYAHEQKVTALIYHLVDLALELKDHATNQFLQWFVSEQVEEEANALEITLNLELVKNSPHGLFILDRELGQRKAENE